MEVNLYKATAMVEHDDSCRREDLVAAIERIGYLTEIDATNHHSP